MIYSETEIQKVMQDHGLTRTKAKYYIYHKVYYASWLKEHKAEKQEYRKQYYERHLR